MREKGVEGERKEGRKEHTRVSVTCFGVTMINIHDRNNPREKNFLLVRGFSLPLSVGQAWQSSAAQIIVGQKKKETEIGGSWGYSVSSDLPLVTCLFRPSPTV